jgi:hypothetical protein
MLLCLPLLLGGCEPERGIKSKRDLDAPVDVACADQALRQSFGAVVRWDYVSDGGTFPKGTPVAQIAYYKWDGGVGWATLHIGSVGEGTRVSHEFTGIGAELPQASFPPAMKAMARASAVVQRACGLNLSAMEWREIGQDVEALD